MNKEQKLRYSRHIQLSQIGEEGQERLLASSALIVGMGGLGSPVAMYLAAAGIGRLVLSDYDRVELSNLQRQIVHSMDDIDNLKVASAHKRLMGINPEIDYELIENVIDDDELEAKVHDVDVVIDCSDNFATRFAVNRACFKYKTPLVSGACIQLVGQVASFLPDRDDSPCYECLYKDEGEEGASCEEIGILAPVAGIIGCVQATETIKVLLGQSALCGRLMLLDAESMEWRDLKLGKDPACKICG